MMARTSGLLSDRLNPLDGGRRVAACGLDAMGCSVPLRSDPVSRIRAALPPRQARAGRQPFGSADRRCVLNAAVLPKLVNATFDTERRDVPLVALGVIADL